MISLISDYHTGKPSFKRFQLQFPAQNKKVVKTNENQSFITKKFNPIFQEKTTTNCFDTNCFDKDCLGDIAEVISKFIGVKFRKPPGNTNYSTFPPGKYISVTFFQRGVFYRADFHRGTLQGRFSRGTEATAPLRTMRCRLPMRIMNQHLKLNIL